MLTGRDDTGFLAVNVEIGDRGAFVFDAQDISSDFAEQYWGKRECEWSRTVQPADFPALRRVLGGGPDDDVIDLAVAWCEGNDPDYLDKLVRESDVPKSFETWHSDCVPGRRSRSGYAGERVPS